MGHAKTGRNSPVRGPNEPNWRQAKKAKEAKLAKEKEKKKDKQKKAARKTAMVNAVVKELNKAYTRDFFICEVVGALEPTPLISLHRLPKRN